MNKILFTSALSLVFALSANLSFAQNAKGVVTKASGVAGVQAASEHYWYDGAERKLIEMDANRIVRFEADGKGSIVPRALSQEKSTKVAANESESPLFVDNGRRRALPGGLLVSLKQVRDEQDARDQLKARGLVPVRLIQGDLLPRNWIVASPIGTESLAMANRLHESGYFALVSPNWWTELSKK